MDIHFFGDPDSPIRLVQMADRAELSEMGREATLVRNATGTDFCLCAYAVEDWNRELSPWAAPAVYGKNGFGDGARKTLEAVLESMPQKKDLKMLIGGYSLSALFALWAVHETDRFSGAACASPSAWFPGFTDYMEKRKILTPRVYLSLGEKEEKTKNPVMATVGTRIREIYAHLLESGTDCTLEWNEGGHFQEPTERTAKAFAWLLKKEKEKEEREEN